MGNESRQHLLGLEGSLMLLGPNGVLIERWGESELANRNYREFNARMSIL